MIAPVIPAPTIMTSVSIAPTAGWLGISGKGAPCQIVCPDRRLRWMTDMAVNQYGEKDPALRCAYRAPIRPSPIPLPKTIPLPTNTGAVPPRQFGGLAQVDSGVDYAA